MSFLITLHNKAPLYTAETDKVQLLNQAVDEISSGKYSLRNETVRQVFRQTGFVNFWFFLRWIASYNGPFELLNEDLHLEMCNFFQENLKKGNMAAGFTTRGFFKSTIFTKGGPSWLALRNPDSVNFIFSAKEELSLTFLHTIQRIFDSNEIFAWLYPEYVPTTSTRRWNDREGVLPNRSRYRSEPTWKGCGVGGNTQGVHGNLFLDDTVGEAQLNSERECNAEMKKIGNWVESNIRTLKKNQAASFVFYTATRYAPNDAHAFIFKSLKKKVGFWGSLPYKEKEDGEWVVYNRMAVENGKATFPESASLEFLAKLKEKNPWAFYLQYQNDPFHSGITELATYELRKCKLVWTGREHVIVFWDGQKEETIYLADCYVSQACDPAASEKRTSSKTSKTAVGVHVHCYDDRRFLIMLKAGFVPLSTTYDWMFNNAERFQRYLRGTFLEAQGAFKMLGPEIQREQRRRVENTGRNVNLHLRAVSKTGDKIATIRTTLEPLLQKGLLYADETVYEKVKDELENFPLGTNDILDMWALAQKMTIRPEKPEDLNNSNEYFTCEQDFVFSHRGANNAGY